MKSQQSSLYEQTSCLYLVPTPIGNLEDMTFRALRILKEADVIAAEDTRNTKRLCNYFEITTPLMSYHEHNTEAGGHKILQLLEEGKTIALVSDAGMPCISDPGVDIVTKALAAGYAVVPLPGANAALTALIASGIAPQPFYFYGFLSRHKKERAIELDQLKKRKETMIFYEAPHRLKDMLKHCETVFGNRQIVLARELTKKFEEFLRGTLTEAVAWTEQTELRGEFCIIIEGTQIEEVEAPAPWAALTITQHVDSLIEETQIPSKEAIKEVAKLRGLSKRDVYQAYHVN